ncbi:MAG TPA: hypothetical protein EYP94_03895 [Gammaproteobacteria bacterium]|jgi:hypothetical protein|nr:hypothetical protein [Gammaproteobacteria bacterium]
MKKDNGDIFIIKEIKSQKPGEENSCTYIPSEGGGFFCGDVTVTGDNGYYAISVGLRRSGVILESEYYEDGEDDW